jgi:uncharacterized pyridoxamine 5'-phosphate oxidase family protein
MQALIKFIGGKFMIDYVSILKQFPNGVLATQSGKGVRTRVFQFQFAEGNKLYFCTQGVKPVYDQLKANPDVSFCTYTQDFNPVVSVNGKAVFTENAALKERAINDNPLIKDIYQRADNPIFKLFYIEVEGIETFSFAEGPQSYKI